jgi:putative ABC transport system substrate-binding protein
MHWRKNKRFKWIGRRPRQGQQPVEERRIEKVCRYWHPTQELPAQDAPLFSGLVVRLDVGNLAAIEIENEDPKRRKRLVCWRWLSTSLTSSDRVITRLAAISFSPDQNRLELLRELVPGAVKVAVLVDPAVPPTETALREVEGAARTMGLRIQVLNASSSSEINAAFATLARDRPDALFVGPGFLFTSRRVQLVHLATLHKVPATYQSRDFAEAGGLMSYGPNFVDAYRQLGVYVGRILNGTKPSDLPVVQSTKFELVINAETARMLGLAVPPTLLAVADEVIE